MTREGLRKLFETQLRYDLGWLEKDLKALRMLGTLAVTLVTPDDLQKQALESIRHWVTDPMRLMGPLVGKAPGQVNDPGHGLCLEGRKICGGGGGSEAGFAWDRAQAWRLVEREAIRN